MSSTQPTYTPDWALTDATLPVAQTANKIRPKESLRNIGYDKDQIPTAQELNWQLHNIAEWIGNLKYRLDTIKFPDQPDVSGFITMNDAYPIGSIYMNASNAANPATFLGIGTWEPLGQGRVLIGHGDTTDARGEYRAYTSGSRGGEYQQVLSEAQIPSHRHITTTGDSRTQGIFGASGMGHGGTFNAWYGAGSLLHYTSWTGGGQAHNNVQPFLVVYMWQRTA